MSDESLSFIARLKQHHLYGVVVAYAVVVGFLIQLVSRAFPYFGWAAAVPVVIIVLLLGFPVVMVLAWTFIKPKDPAKYTVWQRRRWKLGATLSAVAVVVVVLSGFYTWRFSTRYEQRLAELAATRTAVKTAVMPVARTISAKSVAVLPFENLSSDANNEYFVAGIQSLILTKLADIRELKVISRASTRAYQSHPEELKTIGQQLGVATILEGGVQKVGNQVLINVQLIDARTDEHIWAQSYQRTLENVFGVEGEVAEKIAAALKAKLSPAETARLASGLSADPAANNLFLRAEYFANQGFVNYDTASFKTAIPLYRQAIEQAPDFALARARLSHAESILAWFGGGGGDLKHLRTDARMQAERALKLAPELPAAHLAIGYSDYYGKGDYAAALKAFDVVVTLRPDDTDALAARGFVLRRQGRFDAASDSLQKALVLDPRNSSLAYELGGTYMLANRYPEAEQATLRALALDPDNVQAKLQNSRLIVYSNGDLTRALTAVQGDSPALQLRRVALLTLQRRYRAALELLDAIADTPDNFSLGAPKTLLQANLYRKMGDPAKAQPLFREVLPKLRAILATQVGNLINQAYTWSEIASAELGLGHMQAGLAAIAKSQALIEQSGDHVYGPDAMKSNAVLYAEIGRADLAVPLLAKALATPGISLYYSPVLLWLSDAWDPIRDTPAFQDLLKQYAKYQPAASSAVPMSQTAP